MKKTFLTLICSMFMLFAFAANDYKQENLTKQHETTISTVHVDAPCRIIYKLADSTYVRVSKDFAAKGLYYEIKDSIIFIKQNVPFNDYEYLIKNEQLPIICISSNENTPKIKTSSSYKVAEKNINKTKNGTAKNNKK